MDPNAARKFCDVGFRFTKTGIEFDVDKIKVLKIDPKIIAVIESQAAVHITYMRYMCEMLAIGQIKPDEFLAEMRSVLQYAANLQAGRSKAEQLAKAEVTEKPKEADPQRLAMDNFGIKVEAEPVFKESGDMSVVVNRLLKRYLCQCEASRPKS